MSGFKWVCLDHLPRKGHMDVTRLAQDALRFLIAVNNGSLPQDLGELERMVRQTMQEAGAKVVELHLAGKRLGYEGSRRPCPCGQCQKFMEHRPRTLATTLGPVRYHRAYYHCKHCGQGCCPYDRACGLCPALVSEELAQGASLLAVHDPFSPCAPILHRLTGQRLSEGTIRALSGRAGKKADQRERQAALAMATWSVPLVIARPKRLYVAVDAAMVHFQDGWHDVKCAVCWWEDERGRRHKQCVVRKATAEEFRAFVWALAGKCGLETAVEVVLLGDGAAWIWEHMAGILGEGTICITDWYHVSEHLWTCGKVLMGEGTERTKQWVKALETLLWEGKTTEALGRLEVEHGRRRGSAREAVRQLMNYLKNQGDRLRYDQFRAKGLDVGSGQVEAACKQMGLRMKRCGARWSEAGAQAILSLRSVWLNGQWDPFWQQHPLAA